jgi:hypothetical protein
MKERDMTQRYRKFQRAWGMYYAFGTVTGNSVGLKTKDKAQANHLVAAMNEASQQAAMNLSLAKVYLRHSDPLVAKRTWQHVMDEIIKTKTGENQIRWQVMAKSKWFDPIRNRLLIETQAEHLLHVLQCGKVSINVYLRRMHNFAIDMNWLPASVLPKRQWPAVKFKDKRAITLEEHEKIIVKERNPERNVFYQLCWHLGASQGDIASLTGEDADCKTAR